MTDFYVPANHKDYLIQGLIEVLGTQDASEFVAALQKNRPTSDDLEVQGFLIRGGRAGFYYWLNHNNDRIGWNSPEYRLNPVKKKITTGLQGIIQQLETESEYKISLINEANQWRVVFAPQAEPESPAIDSICSYLRGFLQEFCRWAGLGKFYIVQQFCTIQDEESRCEITILKEPLD